MRVFDAFQAFGLWPEHRLKLNFEQLQRCGLDLGFTTSVRDGKDIHQLTGELAVSFMNFHDGGLTNLLFHQRQPIYLDFDDEITAYYSDYIEIRYIMQGTLEVEFEGKIAHFHEGDVCFINSMAYHRESIANSDCLLLNISIQKDFFTEAFLDKLTLTPLRKFLRKNILRYSDERHYIKFSPNSEEQSDLMQDYMYRIVVEAVNRETGYLDISKGYTIRLMCELSDGYQFDFNKQETAKFAQKLFDTVSDYMKVNLQTVTMAALSQEFHYQPNYFNLLIKKHTGMTYSDYLTYLRIERARQYLEATDIIIDEIMWLVGYTNKGFFYKKFAEQTGFTPSKYRKGNHRT